MSWFLNLFKSHAQREAERLKKEANDERMHDIGRNYASHVIAKIDSFYEGRGSDIAIELLKIFRGRMVDLHKGTVGEVLEEYQRFTDIINEYAAKIEKEAEDDLGELKYQIIEIGIRDTVRKYINKKANDITELLLRSAKEDAMYAYARINGIISDEEHQMDPDEFNEHIERKRKANHEIRTYEI